MGRGAQAQTQQMIDQWQLASRKRNEQSPLYACS